MTITEIKVLGDSGKVYTITVKDSEAKCSCPANNFHPETACKHMRFALETLGASA